MDNWDGSSDVPYPTQNPDEREMNIGTDGVDPGRDYVLGYSNHDELEPGMLESQEKFYAALDKRKEQDKAICFKKFPEKEQKKLAKECYKKRKADFINSMKFKENFPDMSGGG